MLGPFQKNILRNSTIILFLTLSLPLFAQEDILNEETEELSELQKQARYYRSEGLILQQAGNLEGALSYYQKAIELDPFYAVAYNDLGIIYETKGELDRAEESYLKSIKVNPDYLSAYSNLGLLYEIKRELDKASHYWRKRADLGLPDDPWTLKAKRRLNDILAVLGKRSIESEEQDVIDLTKDVLAKKSILRQNNKDLAEYYLERARISYKKGDDIVAYREALNAKQLDPSNREVDEFIERIQIRLLSK